MTQGDIDRFLYRHKPRWFSSSQLADALKVSKASINHCLVRMRKYNEIKENPVRVVQRSRIGFMEREVPFYSYKG